MRFETGKKKGTTIFQVGKYAQHMLIFFTDFRLDMLISVMLIKKTCSWPWDSQIAVKKN